MLFRRTFLLLMMLAALPLGAAESDLRLFDAVWEVVCRRHYDPDFAENHRSLRDRYRPQVAAAKTPNGAAWLINQMLAETGESHLALLLPELSLAFLAAEESAASLPARFSTSVTPLGTQTAILGFLRSLCPTAF